MKNCYNFVMSILGACFTVIFLILSIVFHAIDKNILGVVFSSIFYLFIILYFIFNSIYYMTDSVPLYRLSNVISSVFSTLILVFFLLNYSGYSKWIILGIMILLLILEIIIDSFDKLIEIKYLFTSIKLVLLIFLFINFYTKYILLLGICSVVLYYVSRLVGRLLKNKIFLSYDIISLIMFGIFFLFI